MRHSQTNHKESMPLLWCLPLVDLGNPSLWITCRTLFLLRMTMNVSSWSSTDSRRWPLSWPARRISQQKPLLNSSLNECGYTFGSHSLSSHIETVGSLVHFGPASCQCRTPSSPSPQFSIPKLMARERVSTRLSLTVCACTTQIIHAHGMRSFPMYKISIIRPSTSQPTIAPFRWAWDSNHYVPLM